MIQDPLATSVDRSSVIELDGVVRTYGDGDTVVRAVWDASWVFWPGTMTCIFGVSGSGKSTLLNLLGGLDVATEGAVLHRGRDLGSLNEDQRAEVRLREIGIVFQDHLLIDEFTALENVMLPLEATQTPRDEARRQALAALADVGLGDLGHRLPTQLSGGQRQRVGIARARVGDKPLLLADEPSGALDAGTSAEIFALLRSIADQGVTVIIATHDSSAAQIADTTLQVIDGRLHEIAAHP